MDDDRQLTRRELSYALFGNRAMIDVILAIQAINGKQGVLTTRVVAALTGMADSVVRPVMIRLVSARLLTAAPKLGGPRSPQYFSINETPSWTAVLALCSEAISHDAVLNERRSSR